MEWRLEPLDGGARTQLHLREDGFLDGESRKENVEGRDHELGELRTYLTESD